MVAPANGPLAEPGADCGDYGGDDFFRRPGRGRRALRRTAMVFLRLLTRPPLRPFSLLARFLASLRTSPPRRPSATACGFFLTDIVANQPWQGTSCDAGNLSAHKSQLVKPFLETHSK